MVCQLNSDILGELRYYALCGYVHLQKVSATRLLSSIYQMQKELFKDVVAGFIEHCVISKNQFEPQFVQAVNA